MHWHIGTNPILQSDVTQAQCLLIDGCNKGAMPSRGCHKHVGDKDDRWAGPQQYNVIKHISQITSPLPFSTIQPQETDKIDQKQKEHDRSFWNFFYFVKSVVLLKSIVL